MRPLAPTITLDLRLLWRTHLGWQAALLALSVPFLARVSLGSEMLGQYPGPLIGAATFLCALWMGGRMAWKDAMQGTLNALHVSPVSSIEYLQSKALTLGGTACAMGALTLLCFDGLPLSHSVMFLVGLGSTGLLGVLLGIWCASRQARGRGIALCGLVLLIAALPWLWDKSPPWLGDCVPTGASFALIQGSIQSISTPRLLLGLGIGLAWPALVFEACRYRLDQRWGRPHLRSQRRPLRGER